MISGVTLSATPSRSHLLFGLPQPLVVMLELHTEPTTQRAPFELCIVLDRSSSMCGSCMRDAKAAISAVIDALGQDDVLHVVTYDDEAHVIFERGDLTNRAELHTYVDAIDCGGATNIGAGLERAGDILRAGGPGRYRRIFLYSDGRPNLGMRTVEELGAISRRLRMFYGIVTSAYGIGEAFHEEVMMEIAAQGGGRYAYVDEARIGHAMEQAMMDLFATLGTGSRLIVQGMNGAEVTSVLGYDTSELENGVDCGEIHSGNHRKFLVEMEVGAIQQPDLQNPDPFERTVLSFTLQYTPVVSYDGADLPFIAQFPHSAVEGCKPKPVVVSGTATVSLTSDPDIAAHRNSQVQLALSLYEVAGAVDDVAGALGQADVEEAKRTLQMCISELRRHLHQDTEGMVDVLLGRAERMLRRLEKCPTGNYEREVKKAHHYAKMSRRFSFDELKRDYSPTAGNRHRRQGRHSNGRSPTRPLHAQIPLEEARFPPSPSLLDVLQRYARRRHSSPASGSGSPDLSETESVESSIAHSSSNL